MSVFYSKQSVKLRPTEQEGTLISFTLLHPYHQLHMSRTVIDVTN